MIEFIKHRKGSSTVFLAIVFVAFAMSIAASIDVARRIVVNSECEVFGRIWTRAILSEYDRHLMDDYGIMAYFGNEAEVKKRIDIYQTYSFKDKLDIRLGGAGSALAGYELGDPDVFRSALRKGAASGAIGSLIHRHERAIRDEDAVNDDKEDTRVIGNQVVIDTLPSAGTHGHIDADSVINKARELGSTGGIKTSLTDAGAEMALIQRCFNNHLTYSSDKKSWFNNEWEYILSGKLSDQDNLTSCKTKLFMVRNALNLVALYKDPEKVELLTAVSELITPGPLGTLTQAALAEVWAALESKSDIEELYKGGRIPVIKNADEWITSLESVLGSKDIRDKLDEESRQLLDENMDELRELDSAGSVTDLLTRGLNYDDYLLLMMLTMNENTRLLRTMDLIQINMKYRYYRDFNMMEYYTGVRLSISANGRDYTFEDMYR